MSYSTQADAIRAYFASRWTAVGDGTTIVYENLDYEPQAGTAYVLFGVRPIESAWVSPGSVDSIGAVSFAVLSPSNVGPEAAEGTATAIATALSRQSDSGVQYMEASIDPIGADGNGFYQVNVRVPYFVTESV